MNRIKYIIIMLITIGNLFSVPRNLVVVELFTSTLCTGCPGSAMGIHDLETNGHSVAIMTNHYNDPFVNATSLARYQYYGAAGTPTAFFDGADATISSSYDLSLYPEYLPKVNAHLAIPSHYTISAEAAIDSLSYSTTVTLNKAEADTNSTVVLHAVVTESGIPYIWLNQTTLENLNRMMIPDHNGTPVQLASLAIGEQLNIPLNFTVKDDWNLDNCRVIFWLQNYLTKEILQGAQYTLAELTNTIVTNHPPQITLPEGFDFQINESLRLDFAPYVSDADDDVLRLDFSGNASLSVEIDGLDVIITAPQDWYGSEELVFTISDGLDTNNDSVLVTVNNITEPLVSIIREDENITLVWAAIDNVSTYGIWVSDSPVGSFYFLGYVGGTSWTEPILPGYGLRFYRVIAYSR